jgi:hypothetical protein
MAWSLLLRKPDLQAALIIIFRTSIDIKFDSWQSRFAAAQARVVAKSKYQVIFRSDWSFS